jgi:hypothetical protein
MSGRSGKRKGDGYEREIAGYLNDNVLGGNCAFRAPLSGGGRSFSHGVDPSIRGGSADLIGTPGVWVEAKRVEAFAPYKAMDQAECGIEGRKSQDIPVVVTRRNRIGTEDSLVVMRLKDWAEFYKAWLGRQQSA